MREIKFRAWDQGQLDSDAGRMFCGSTFEIFNEEDSGVYSGFILPNGDWTPLILMQYIGLKDKNGKKIFEGDIVKQIYHPFGARKEAEYSKIGTVTFKKGSFGTRWQINECKYFGLPEELKGNRFYQPYREGWKHPTNPKWIDESFHNIEIIGNIYENPELLKN